MKFVVCTPELALTYLEMISRNGDSAEKVPNNLNIFSQFDVFLLIIYIFKTFIRKNHKGTQ